MASEMTPRSVPPERWNGVNLGGWLLLEPGPSYPLFERHKIKGKQVRCEWDLMKVLSQKKQRDVITRHRETYITKEDFKHIRDLGLNAVRLPFGYWIAVGPSRGEPYHGPAIEYIDRAIEWADEFGLQILLDLHGCPGGESGDAPCGHRQRPIGTWHWRHWRCGETLRVLDFLACRYRNRKCITGITVCNEPSKDMPVRTLCRYYAKAVDRIRKAGMEQITVVLPVFQRPLKEFFEVWNAMTGGKLSNICFDVHWYHCFDQWNAMTLAQHLRAVEKHAVELLTFPAVVGEWSLALGLAAQTAKRPKMETLGMFARAQLEAYKNASHGSFFWNWKDRAGVEWHYQQAQKKGFFASPVYSLPPWDGRGEDPLEDELDPPPMDPTICLGDKIYLRAFHGKYIDVASRLVRAQFADRGSWQCFKICSSKPGNGGWLRQRRAVCDGEVVHLLAHNGKYLAVRNEEVCASPKAKDGVTEFIVHSGDANPLRHRSRVSISNRVTGESLLADDKKDRIQAGSHDLGRQQEFVLEKATQRGKKRSLSPGKIPRRSLTPEKTPCCKRQRQVVHSPCGCIPEFVNAKDVGS